jgi:hypothetical protein
VECVVLVKWLTTLNLGVAVFKIPKKVSDRFVERIKAYQQIALSHKDRDVSEADTVTVVKDILSDVFGFDKYAELTSEHQVKNTFCDLAVRIDGKVHVLIEVKAAGITLNSKHIQQALNYGVNLGTEWIVLTNAVEWHIYKVKFGQPVDFEEVSRFEFASINPKNEDAQRTLFLLCREGLTSNAMLAFHNQAQILNQFTIGQILLSDPVTSLVRREFRRLFPDIRVEGEDVKAMLLNEILKREVVEGDKAREAQKRIGKLIAKQAKVNSDSKKDKASQTDESIESPESSS